MDDTTDKEDIKINDSGAEGATLADSVSEQAVDTATQVDFLVKSLIAEQADIREKLKEQRAMLKDVLASDATYRDIEEKIKDMAKRKKQVQQALADTQAARKAKEEIQSLQNDLKSVDKKLEGYLAQYLETYQSRTIEDRDGNLREIVTQYKLVRKQS